MKRDNSAKNAKNSDVQPISFDVLKEKYLKAGETGYEDVFKRVARALASVEKEADRARYEAV